MFQRVRFNLLMLRAGGQITICSCCGENFGLVPVGLGLPKILGSGVGAHPQKVGVKAVRTTQILDFTHRISCPNTSLDNFSKPRDVHVRKGLNSCCCRSVNVREQEFQKMRVCECLHTQRKRQPTHTHIRTQMFCAKLFPSRNMFEFEPDARKSFLQV